MFEKHDRKVMFDFELKLDTDFWCYKSDIWEGIHIIYKGHSFRDFFLLINVHLKTNTKAFYILDV